MVRDHEKIHTRGEIVKADSSMKFVSGCGLLYECPKCLKRLTRAAAVDHMAKIHNQHIENVDNFCFQCKVVVDDYRNHIKRHLSFQCQTEFVDR
ncbi:CLUMA_CG004744, isoform A [Clunio marinus]|uniref:CLUMA_CG004744, isoform A n=1 Tax=Clunio marinus TaxID=568069 RepID=A0A1J1HSK2_9DIPT|nr:CLUMA_CG004744, isoform A [Clunio marinus]